MSSLLDLASTVVGWALPGEQLEAYVSRSRTTNVRAYEGAVESLSSASPVGAGVRVIVDGRQGFAWAGTLDEVVLKETLEEARDNARFAEPDEFAGLAVPDGVAPPELDLVRPELVSYPTEAKVDLALEVERVARARDPRVTGVRMASYSDGWGETAIASTTGIAVTTASGTCYVSVMPLLSDGGDTQAGYGLSAGRQPSDLVVESAVADGVDRAARLLGATKPASGRVVGAFDPEVTADLLAIIGGVLSGDAVLKGRSFFADRVGALVAAPAVSLVSDPTDPDALGAGTHDGEGLAHRRVPLISEGVLGGFLYDSYSARRAGTRSTGSASRGYSSVPGVGAPSLRLAPGSLDQEALIASIDDGVYIQDVSGLHSGVNPVSGDFSVGVTGLAIRRGALAEPFQEATIASTLQRMLLDVVAVGSDHRWTPGGPAGVTLVISDLSLSGT